MVFASFFGPADVQLGVFPNLKATPNNADRRPSDLPTQLRYESLGRTPVTVAGPAMMRLSESQGRKRRRSGWFFRFFFFFFFFFSIFLLNL